VVKPSVKAVQAALQLSKDTTLLPSWSAPLQQHLQPQHLLAEAVTLAVQVADELRLLCTALLAAPV
jgi:hypothetical protein